MSGAKCSAEACDLDSELQTEPCSECGRGVHHICSNAFYDKDIAKRFCSRECVLAFEARVDQSGRENANGNDSDSADDTEYGEDCGAEGKTCDGENVIDVEAAIPSHVRHTRPSTGRGDIWKHIHTLDAPQRRGNKICRNICLLCVEKALKKKHVPQNAWKKGLCNTSNSSNAKMHLRRKHSDHPLGAAAEADSASRASDKIKRSESELSTFLGKAKRPDDASIASSKRLKPFIEDFFRPSKDLVNTSISKWLNNDGHPYSIAATPAFLELIRVATGNPAMTVLARDTHNDSTVARFKMFCETVGNLLAFEHSSLHGMKFLTLIHDAWTCNKKSGVIGASVAFIDHQWRFRHIALLATVKNDGHAAHTVAKLIENCCQELYKADVVAMTKWVMSDTTASARSVASYFEDATQEDCSMHILNLCIGYGVGMKENFRTVKTIDPSTGITTSTKEIVTEGGPLPQGAELIRKLRNLNNYFSTPKRREKLTAIQNAHNLPVLAPLLDIDVRVASTCRLMRRSIVNFTAMKLYFIDEQQVNPFTSLTEADWTLAREIEGTTRFLAQLALAEVQSETLVASYMLVFRAAAEADLKSRRFLCLSLTAMCKDEFDEKQLPREPRQLERFSAPGKVCVARCLAQVKSRFPCISANEVVTLMLDPRTKLCAGDIVDGMGCPAAHRNDLLSKASSIIVDELVRVFQFENSNSKATRSDSSDSSPERNVLTMLPSAHDTATSFLFGSPVPRKTKRGYHETRLKEDAAAAMKRWMDYQEDWIAVAVAQGVSGDRAYLSKTLCFRKSDETVCWNLMELCRIDILRWFRDTGEPLFPTLSKIARIWLGKVSSTAFQERVFSTGGHVMSPDRSQLDNDRAEMSMLLRHNRASVHP